MKGRVFLGWWVYFLAWCCMNVYWSAADIKGHDWSTLAVDGPFTILWFFVAHFSWEKGYYE